MVLYVGMLNLFSKGREGAGPLAQFLAGGSAGTLCWLSVLPFDVLKSRMQAIEGAHYTGMLDCARKAVKKEGFGVFTRGGGAVALRAFPVNGVTFIVVESLLKNCRENTV